MSNDTNIGNLVAKLTLDTSGFTSSASSIDASSVQKSVQSAVDDYEIDIRNFNIATEADELKAANDQLSQIQNIQDDAFDFGMKILKAGVGAVATAKNIETEWARVKTAVSVSPDIDPDAYFSGLKNEAYQLSTEIPENLSTIMQTMQAAGKADVSAESISGFTKAVLQLQEASGGTFKTDTIISYFNQLHSLTGASYDDSERWGSALVALASDTTATEKEIMSTANSIAAIGTAANMSVPEILGWGTYMAEVGGVSGKTFQKLVEIVDDGTGDITGNLSDLLLSLNQMRLDDIENKTTTYNDALEELGLNTRFYAEDLAKLTANTDGLTNDLQTAEDAFSENTALVEAAATATDTLDSQLLIAQNTLTVIQAQLGDALLPVLKNISDILLPMLRDVTRFFADHPDLAGVIMGVAIAFEALAMAAQVASVAMAMGSIGLAPWIGAVAIIGALVGVVVLLAQAFENVHEMTAATLEDIENMNPAIDDLTEIAGQLYIVDKFFNNIEGTDVITGEDFEAGTWVQYDEIRMGWVRATEEEAAMLNERLAETSTLASDAVDSLEMDSVGEQLTDSTEAAGEAIATTSDIMDQFNQQMSAFNEMTGQLSGTMSDDLTGSMDQINQLLESQAIQQFINQPISEEVGTSWETYGQTLQSAADSLENLDNELGDDTIAGKIEGTGAAANSAAEGFANLTAEIYGTIDAYLALLRVGFNGGKGGGNGLSQFEFRANGGPVRKGNTYWVGERGVPELFTPDRNGYIIPYDEVDQGRSDKPEIVINGNIYGESYLKNYVLKLMSGTIKRELRLAE